MSTVIVGWSDPRLADVLGADGGGVVVRSLPLEQGWSRALSGHETAIVRETSTGDDGHPGAATAALLAAAEAVGLRRLVYVTELGHDMDASAGDLSPAALAQAEVQAAAVDWTILRMAPLYGAGDDFLRGLARIARVVPVVPLPAEGGWRVQPLAARDAADAVLAVLADPLTVGGVYELAGPEALGLPDLMRRILAAMGARRGVALMPEARVKQAWRALTLLSRGPAGLRHVMALDRVAVDNRAAALLARSPSPADPEALAYLRG